MHAIRRVAVVLALALTMPLVVLNAAPAHADICGVGYDLPHPAPDPYVEYPCPGKEWQPVGAPTWVTTEYGPGAWSSHWQFIKVTEGSRVFLSNVNWPTAIRLHGTGFDSGLVPKGSAREVAGVPQLKVGHYTLYDELDDYVGDLYIEPAIVRLCC